MIKKSIKPSNNSNSGNKPVPGSDFVILGDLKLQTNAVIFANGGQGKTTLVTDYCPDPIAFISLDRRGDQAVKKAMDKGRKIFFLRVDTPANPSRLDESAAKKLGQEAVRKVIKNFEWAVEQSRQGKVRTICIDTGTELSEMINLAVTGKEVRVKGDYGKSKDLINREFWRFYNLAREGNAHFVMLARAQEVWESNEPTGRFKPRGPEVISDAADWCGYVKLKTVKEKIAPGKSRKVARCELQITKAGLNIEELGTTYTADDWGEHGPFCWAAWMQFLETSDIEDWK